MTAAAVRTTGRGSGSPRLIGAIGVLVIAAGCGVAVLRYVGGTPPEHGVEGAAGAFALGSAVGAPGLLALLALSDRPALLLPAAAVLMPLAFLSFAGVLLPLLLPSALLFLAYGRRTPVGHRDETQAVLVTVVVLGLLIGAVLSLFLNDDPRSYATATVSGSTSDVITFGESLLSLALTGAALAAGWVLAAPRRR